MAKSITILTLTLLFIALFLGTLTYLYKKTPVIEAPKGKNEQPTEVLQSESALRIIPEIKSVQAEKPQSMAVTIDTNGNYPTEIQLEMSYDPTVLTNLQIFPGEIFPTAKIVLNNVDTATGRISYAIVLPQNQTTTNISGTVARISFIPSNTKPETQISFLPKTTIYSLKQQITLKQMQGANIVVSHPQNIASQSSQLTHQTLPMKMPVATLPVK